MEMEQELFQSKLRPFVDHALISDIIETSSTGKHPHRTEAMGWILKSSIQERCQRKKVKNASRSDPASQPEGSTETPVPAPQLLSRLTSNSVIASASTKIETLPGSPTLSEHVNGTNVGRFEEPPAKTKTDALGKHTVTLACSRCNARALPSRPWSHSPFCFYGTRKPPSLKCTGCETDVVWDSESCTKCHGKFEG